MAGETTMAHERSVSPINGISGRTRAFGNSRTASIYFRARDLRNRYGGTTNAERERNARNVQRINRAMERMINNG